METLINENPPLIIETKMGKKVLIATVYKPDPVLLASTRLGPERIILLVSKETCKEQEDSVKLIQDSLGKVIDIKVMKIDMYDIVEIAKKVVDIIDVQPAEDELYVNITSGRKTQAIGLLLASYARHEKVKKIAYNPEEDKGAIVYLPRLSFNLNEAQKKILEEIEKKKYASIADLAEKINLSTAMAYRHLDDLKNMDLVSADNGVFELTDAGKIARL